MCRELRQERLEVVSEDEDGAALAACDVVVVAVVPLVLALLLEQTEWSPDFGTESE